MAINTRQFDQLTEMGISLWQKRTKKTEQNHAQVTTHYQMPNLESLTNNRCFNDILLAIDLSIGEVTQQEQSLNLGLFNWFFFSNDANASVNQEDKTAEITYRDNQLFTPSINQIANSPTLKKALWHTLNTEIL
ncbi:DNA polymerase III subunit psi [Colwellia sp. D2M02]|uniref:DNA polymerase III subunit psi n=1 Tax=Colwellia sp. D2M02 TaxID=2841562 RepID=UPI001C081A9B|nr:DNA polymerase III subunit psi [Colwellia sp. D2M02]MBU2894245.1 DNA polymerase III subunit psi [Colwellia sp. D2M02]